MFIVLEDDIFEGLETITKIYDSRFIALDNLFESMYNGEHIVYTNIKNLMKLKNNEKLSPRTRAYTGWIIRNFSILYGCKAIVDSYITVSTKYTRVIKSTDGRVIKTPIEFMKDITETKLLTEHESDAKFYQQLTKYVLKKKGNGNKSFFSVQFENDAYHGANGKAKIEQVSLKNRLVLAVVDTDKDYPEDSLKSTYEGVKSGLKIAEKRIPIELLVLPVREKENLLTPTLYKEICDNALIKIIAEKFSNDEVIVNYFDIKGGIKKKKIRNHDDNWETYYCDLIDECRNQKICDECFEDVDLDEKYIKGIGDKICDTMGDLLFEDDINLILDNKKFNCYPEAKIKQLKAKAEILLNEVPDFVFNNWEDISLKVFTWGCCIDKSRFPAQRNW